MTENTINGQYFDGRHPVAHNGTISLVGTEAVVSSDLGRRGYPMHLLRISPRVAGARRHIALPDGGQFLGDDSPSLDQLPQDSRSEGIVGWLEQWTLVAAFGVLVVVAAMLYAYFYGLPAAAERVAQRMPIETEQALGAAMMDAMDDSNWFRPTAIEDRTLDSIRADFRELVSGLPMELHYRLEFRASPIMGANAFALPGGTIVLTDELVEQAASQDEVAAVLAHEIGHVERRHILRHILQDSAVAVVIATLTGDAASLSVAVAAAPTLLMQLKYSREFETEADSFAFRRLKETGRSPAHFATIMERLFTAEQNEEQSRIGDFGFLSTHPLTAERIERARAAADSP